MLIDGTFFVIAHIATNPARVKKLIAGLAK